MESRKSKKPSAKQLAARRKLSRATKKAHSEYIQMPENMKTVSKWHELVRKHMAK